MGKTFCLFLCLSAAAVAQTFEVASIKPNTSGDRGSSTNSNRGETIIRNQTLKQLVQRAYGLEDYALSAPDWLTDLRFDISAKLPPSYAATSATDAERRQQRQSMLQALLLERFKLKIHHEEKVMSAYAMIPAKGGLKVKPDVGGDGGSSTNEHNGHLTVKGLTMPDLASWLSRQVGRPVVDQTAAKGGFSFEMDFTPEERLQTDPAKVAESSPVGPTIYTALQEKVGLKLQAQKLSVDIVVVDHIERVPTEN